MYLKRICLCCIILGSFVIGGCSPEKEEHALFLLEEVRGTIQSDYNQLKEGKWGNVKTNDFEVQFTNKNEIYNLEISRKKEKLNGKKMKRLISNQIDISKQYLGKDIRDKDFEIGMIFDDNTGSRYSYNEKFMKELENGNYDKGEISFVLYDKMEEKEKYMQMNQDYSLVWMSSGKAKQLGGSVATALSAAQGQAENAVIYSKNDLDTILQKKYLLKDGEISIKEGIEFVEDYINNRKKYPVNTDSIPQVVDQIYVMPLHDELYEYYFTLRRTYDGISFDSSLDGRLCTSEEENTVYDVAGISMIGKEDIDFFYGSIDNSNITRTGESITKIVTLKEAVQNVLKNIDKKSEIVVKNIEFLYRSKSASDKQETEYAYPVWKVSIYNGKTETLVYYFVNAVTGEMEIVPI